MPKKEMAQVTVASLKNFQNVVRYGDGGGREFVIDEPPDFGGDGAGPDPYTLLLAALGGCTSMTVSMYARRKKWNLESVSVSLSQNRVHAKDCENCESETGAFVHQINVSIKLEGDLTGEQRERLLEIARKCPVKKTLTSEIVVSYD
jgi:putative redox protein